MIVGRFHNALKLPHTLRFEPYYDSILTCNGPFYSLSASRPVHTFNICLLLSSVEYMSSLSTSDTPAMTPDELINPISMSTNAEGRTLITALRGVIVQIILPNSKGFNEAGVGADEEEFLVALRKYISCIIRDHVLSDGQEGTKRTVNLGGTFSDIVLLPRLTFSTDVSTSTSSEAIAHQNVGQSVDSEPSRLAEGLEENYQETVESPCFDVTVPQSEHSRFLNEALTNLRERVFNKMPIRLLSFQKNGSKLNIALLDRQGIYSTLAQKLTDEVMSIPYDDLPSPLKHSEFIAGYAILSHTWLRSISGEVTYCDWAKSTFDTAHEGYRKLVNFCKVASEDHGLILGWMDTVCIDKSSSSELDESIRSMYTWYRNAEVCIAYLANTVSISDMANDSWFTRGWTLQELTTPRRLKFYGQDWKPMIESCSPDGVVPAKRLKTQIDTDLRIKAFQQQIQHATTITADEFLDPSYVSISRKMQWAANREVTREEDMAYSLMGIFGINMSIAYGEGSESAFSRLLKEILNIAKNDIFDVFNWGGEYNPEASALLPKNPRAYLQRSEAWFTPSTLLEPLTLTHLGLRIPILLLPAVPIEPQTSEYANSAIGADVRRMSLRT